MKAATWVSRLGAVVGLSACCAGCGPDVTLECLAGVVAVNDVQAADPGAFCAACFDALKCDGADGAPDCPTGITGSCSADVAEREYCCEGDCITCP